MAVLLSHLSYAPIRSESNVVRLTLLPPGMTSIRVCALTTRISFPAATTTHRIPSQLPPPPPPEEGVPLITAMRHMARPPQTIRTRPLEKNTRRPLQLPQLRWDPAFLEGWPSALALPLPRSLRLPTMRTSSSFERTAEYVLLLIITVVGATTTDLHA